MPERNFSTEHTSFLTSDGLELPGLLFTPQRPTKKVAIFLHGNGSASVFYKANKMAIFAQALAAAGWAFFPFNNRGAHYLKKFRQHPNKEERYLGTWLEKIEEAHLDIAGAITFLKSRGFTDIVLVGESSGANKICVYNHFQPNNSVMGYALVGGGDDTGLWYQMLGREVAEVVAECETKIEQGRGEELLSPTISHGQLSYQSLLDTIDPDGLYNCFPFLEASGQAQLSTKPLFHLFAQIKKPTLILYGALDTFCVIEPQQAVEFMTKAHPQPELLTGKVVENADHSFEGQEQAEVDAIIEWIGTL